VGRVRRLHPGATPDAGRSGRLRRPGGAAAAGAWGVPHRVLRADAARPPRPAPPRAPRGRPAHLQPPSALDTPVWWSPVGAHAGLVRHTGTAAVYPDDVAL